MSKKYRVTPKNGKWIIQKIDDRTTVSAKPFIKKTDAENAMYAMEASNQKTKHDGSITFNQAFKKFAEWKLSLHSENGRVDFHSLQRYDTEYRQRISKYMNKEVLLSDFNIVAMEEYLDNLKAAEFHLKQCVSL